MSRDCGECSACCYLCEIKEIQKPAHTNCFYKSNEQVTEKCIIFNARPNDCQQFLCAWMRGFGNEQDRPDLNGVMITIGKFNNGTWIFIIETVKNAVLTTAKDMIIEIVKQFDFPSIVSSYDSKPPDDTGDYAIVKESLLSRCKSMIGEFVDYLDSEKQIGLYILRK